MAHTLISQTDAKMMDAVRVNRLASKICRFSELKCWAEETTHLKNGDLGSLKAMTCAFLMVSGSKQTDSAIIT
ncbi:hypothetical protein [Paraburkholderia sp. BCC1885]|uniref:hypothetical protein n=1 Tax=Paraburkholderia sp. BCC1885 TaxID=2562669 RepID=UPI0021B27286|nr:hypothetical protein [Paraburkholderia sp. BCC1885]